MPYFVADAASWRKLALYEHAIICERVRNGELLRVIAADYGLTPERIRQVAAALDPRASELGRSVRAALRREQAAVQAEVQAVQWALHNGPCCVCTGPVTRKRRGDAHHGNRTCSSECRLLWQRLRYHLDPDERHLRMQAHARWILRNSTDPVKQRWAKRELAGRTVSRGTWFQQGSQMPSIMQQVEARRAAVRASGESWWT